MATHLQEGMRAPAFSGTDQDGKKISLADYKGKKLLLYFYPEDDTPTCTIQACNLRDHFAELEKASIAVLGVSPDNSSSHQKFRSKFSLPFSLIADTDHKILQKYGVWGEKQMFGHHYMGVHRTSFLIDEKGHIQKIFLRPKNKQHAAEVLKAL
jgi:peroxiredoxin Q/BCP